MKKSLGLTLLAVCAGSTMARAELVFEPGNQGNDGFWGDTVGAVRGCVLTLGGTDRYLTNISCNVWNYSGSTQIDTFTASLYAVPAGLNASSPPLSSPFWSGSTQQTFGTGEASVDFTLGSGSRWLPGSVVLTIVETASSGNGECQPMFWTAGNPGSNVPLNPPQIGGIGSDFTYLSWGPPYWFSYRTYPSVQGVLYYDATISATTPEPFTMALCAGGLGLAFVRRRRRA